MITIIDRYTGEEICKCGSASVSESTDNTFIVPANEGPFRGRWNAVVAYFAILGGNATQCLLKGQYAVKECLGEK